MKQLATLEQILTASDAAMGGAPALARISSIAAAARCTSPRGEYVTELHSMRGDRLMFIQLWPEHAPLVAYLNGRYAWTRDQFSGAVEPLEPISASIIRAHEFQILPIVMRSRYRDLRMSGQEIFAGTRCHVVGMTDELGYPCRAYFSRETHLWAGMALTDPRQPEQFVRVRVDKWSRVDQVWLPSRVIASDSAGDFVLDFHTVTLNTVNPSIYLVPPEIIAASEQIDRAQRLGKGVREMMNVPEHKLNA